MTKSIFGGKKIHYNNIIQNYAKHHICFKKIYFFDVTTGVMVPPSY